VQRVEADAPDEEQEEAPPSAQLSAIQRAESDDLEDE
jgi:hypothetical protein